MPQMRLGNFSVSLAVKDIEASRFGLTSIDERGRPVARS
jgi:hypothetical protein